MVDYVQLNRKFSLVTQDSSESAEEAFSRVWSGEDEPGWDQLDEEYRTVILAEAGAGKTEEMRQRAQELLAKGKRSFFIRIEDIESNFSESFEVGDQASFENWLSSDDEAWFFLDSVDEARLDNPRNFEKAIRRFARGIAGGSHRAHVILSSRPYAWRYKEDRRLINEELFLPSKSNNDSEEGQKPDSALRVYSMNPLTEKQIRVFSAERGTEDIDSLVREINRANLWSLAERPFDLEGIVAKWAEDKALGGRLALLQYSIESQLRDEHNTNRAQRRPLNIELAKDGARRLAAAVVLTGQSGIATPDSSPEVRGIRAEEVLADWDPRDVQSLLERAVFNDVLYGAVRFRHREVRELLAAEWIAGLLEAGGSRRDVESLIFRNCYGEDTIAPRLRPILPWLILFDANIRRRAVELVPEIAIEDGDPACLPITERKNLLADIVSRIATDTGQHTGRDNTAIARIAQKDLEQDVLELIEEHCDSDEAIFFLGRLVWQGDMGGCVEPLLDIAANATRGLYARVASARAVMACGASEEKNRLLQSITSQDEKLPRELLREIIDGVQSDQEGVGLVARLLQMLPPYERFTVTGLSLSLHNYVDRLEPDSLAVLVAELLKLLQKGPYIERRGCNISEEYAWLLKPATHAIERLVTMRSQSALDSSSLTILLMVPMLRHFAGHDFEEYQGALRSLVPSWAELNDALYWANIDLLRADAEESGAEPPTDDFSISWLGHYWSFDEASIDRLFDCMRTRTRPEDKLIALSTAFRVFVQADRPDSILQRMVAETSSEPLLSDALDGLINPPVSESSRRLQERVSRMNQEHEERVENDQRAKEEWISALKENPDRVRTPPNIEPGQMSRDQAGLLRQLLQGGGTTMARDASCWEKLREDFGGEVSEAYRDAAVSHWRNYAAPLTSEVGLNKEIPWELIFAMAGLEIEARENPDFPNNLDEAQVRHALRFITRELNDFPSWFQSFYRAFPEQTIEAVMQEVVWELENNDPDDPMHYIMHDLLYHAQWLHEEIAPLIMDWMRERTDRVNANKRYTLSILVNGGVDKEQLAALAAQQLSLTPDLGSMAWWRALAVDCDSDTAIPELEEWLGTLEDNDASHAAQLFITALNGEGHRRGLGSGVGSYKNAEHLKSLYILMHRYIKAEDDIDRTGGGAFSPGLRDDAQEARNYLFNLLTEIPGKSSYLALRQLADDHPVERSRPWMARKAYERAEHDSDLEARTAKQVYELHQHQHPQPHSHQQLFELTELRLLDMRDWLERGNDSPYLTWQRVTAETEMRTLVAGWLRQNCLRHYVTAEEPEIANSQRMDILMQNQNVESPVPIELKLLGKGWSGPDLCERLRNQLVGDYLRENNATCGVMLLVWEGGRPNRKWAINEQRVGVEELEDALQEYWEGISGDYPGVTSVKVIVVDLTKRGFRSED